MSFSSLQSPTTAKNIFLLVPAILGISGVIVGAWTLSAPKPAASWRKPVPQTKAHHSPAIAAPVVTPVVYQQMTPDQAVTFNAKVPFTSEPNPPAAAFAMGDASAADRQRAQTCLAMAVYYEAANQGERGEAAVAQVVLNRVRNPPFPKTVCGVVFQGSQFPTGCQFTFTCDGSLLRQPTAAGWKAAVKVAAQALNGYVEGDVGEATHYHTVWVVPYWQSSVLKVAQLGAHIFYRWRGDDRGAFDAQYAGGETIPSSAARLNGDVGTANGLLVEAAEVRTVEPSVRPAAAAEPVKLAALDLTSLSLSPPGPPLPPPQTSNFGHAQQSQHVAW